MKVFILGSIELTVDNLPEYIKYRYEIILCIINVFFSFSTYLFSHLYKIIQSFYLPFNLSIFQSINLFIYIIHLFISLLIYLSRIERFSGEMRVGLHCLLSRVDKSSYDLLFSLGNNNYIIVF